MVQAELENKATLWSDNSPLALKLQEEIKDKGYNLRTVLSGGEKPIFSCPGFFLTGYRDIQRFIYR
ncbi:MAG TPA: hypothetical protein VMC80_01405 [Patescibacteria group bacterium]|nr:hypothetical protein [Patescibacteria group bacterium]